ncbi:response regulator [Roseomonas sp. NAR14]|uniref:Response regulator n=1 Tax=Roseomonas acroporae TaxID=2937791 RepID=A0A9X1Y3T0_9PROT|nr:response regulator [Roseomonas acroporae]MCK8783036.1 response regulator [Roseomonas acroporae]
MATALPQHAALGALLPRLRRYAHAATGHAVIGDAIVRAAVPALRAELERPAWPTAWPLRWRAVAVLVGALRQERLIPLPRGGGLAAAVARLPHAQRHGLLLRLLEDMPPAAIAAILDLPPEEPARQVAAARAALRRSVPARVMIIEDDELIATHITQVVEALGHAVCATSSDETAACAAARRLRPELVVADVHLSAGGSGLVAARRILAEAEGTAPPVLFVTAFPDLVRAEPDSFVVRKPWQEATLRAAIGIALASRPDARSTPS